jgi:uracil-DNA glycosylase family 4
MKALYKAGFANQPTSEHRRDGLRLENAFMTAVVRCPPPQNKPLPSELGNCGIFLDRELALLSNVRVVLTLGRVAFTGYLAHMRRMGVQVRRMSFKHAAEYSLPEWHSVVVTSYHPSRQNTQTRRLTVAMMDQALAITKSHLARHD